jgi:hypothetical protein
MAGRQRGWVLWALLSVYGGVAVEAVMVAEMLKLMISFLL